MWNTPVGERFSYKGVLQMRTPALPKPVQQPPPPIIIGGYGNNADAGARGTISAGS